MQMNDRPEHGAQEHRLRHTGGMGGQDGAREQEYIEGDVRDRGGGGGHYTEKEGEIKTEKVTQSEQSNYWRGTRER